MRFAEYKNSFENLYYDVKVCAYYICEISYEIADSSITSQLTVIHFLKG